MESSIAEFLMRQLASEQLPTSHARAPQALRARQNRFPTTSTAFWRASHTRRRPSLLLVDPLDRWSVLRSGRLAPPLPLWRLPSPGIPSRPFGYDQV